MKGFAVDALDTPVQIDHVAKRFGDVVALADVSFGVGRGETFGLIGPNGSGKTTLIRLLLGLGKPTSGTVRVLGLTMPDHRVAEHIGYMTQASALYGDLSVRENLSFFGRLYGLQGDLLRKRIDETLALVELAERAKAIVTTLSGGMRQRASLACALIHRPQLLFLDEPTVGIDPELRMAFWDYFRELNSQGVTIIISTHHLDEAARCHRLALLRLGKLLAVDSPEALRQRSGASDFDQAFLYYARTAEVAGESGESQGAGLPTA
ncbi:MAG: ABC transporter ATP-binding protein [Chloroflexi bacterium]|nr:MAG: ABC transporter ATP-binding protein [Chloroflexota bacterium]